VLLGSTILLSFHLISILFANSIFLVDGQVVTVTVAGPQRCTCQLGGMKSPLLITCAGRPQAPVMLPSITLLLLLAVLLNVLSLV